MKCTAPWYELNVSAPDNIVSACCYYAGDKEPWRDEPTSIDGYWNSPSMQALRRLQTQLRTRNAVTTHGCSSCFFYENSRPGRAYYDFSVSPPPISATFSAPTGCWRSASMTPVSSG